MLIAHPLILAILTAWGTWSLKYQHAIPREGIYVVGAVLTAQFLWMTARAVAPLEMVRFKSRTGIVIFDVVKEKDQAVEFEQFVAALCAAIRGGAGGRGQGEYC